MLVRLNTIFPGLLSYIVRCRTFIPGCWIFIYAQFTYSAELLPCMSWRECCWVGIECAVQKADKLSTLLCWTQQLSTPDSTPRPYCAWLLLLLWTQERKWYKIGVPENFASSGVGWLILTAAREQDQPEDVACNWGLIDWLRCTHDILYRRGSTWRCCV